MSGKTKILLTSFDGLPSEKQGGPNNIIWKILKSADKKNFSFGFLSYRNYIDDPQFAEGKEVKPGLNKKVTDYLYYNTRLYRYLTSNRAYLKRHFELRDIHFGKRSDVQNYEILHSHDTLSGYYFSKSGNVFKILTIHGNGSIESDWADATAQNPFIKDIIPELKRREILAFNNADIVTFPGEYAKELFLLDYKGKINAGKDIRIVNNGIDVRNIDKIKPDKQLLLKHGYNDSCDAVFLNVAAHVRQKNIEKIIEVVEELIRMKKNPLLINVGTGPLTENLKTLIKRKGLRNNIKLAGKLSHEDVISLMKLSDSVIMMSDRVIFDLVMLEARAAGVPIISDLSGGNEEMLKNYGGLIEIKDKSPEKTAKLIIRNIYEGKLEKTGIGSFPFDISHMMNGYEQIYMECNNK